MLKATVLQSGRMLIDFGGNLYDDPLKWTVALLLPSWFTRNAAHSSEFLSNAKAFNQRSRDIHFSLCKIKITGKNAF